MSDDKEILRKYMETIDSLEWAYNQMKSIDGTLAADIHVALDHAKESTARVAYRIQRADWADSTKVGN